MRCPNDGSELIVTEHQGIDIHSCPICKGVWLERVEFDEITSSPVVSPDPDQDGLMYIDGIDDDFDRSRRRRDRFDDDLDDGFERPRKGKKRRPRRDMLEDMLDF